MAYGISFPSTRLTSYALRAAYGGVGLDTILSADDMWENSAAGTVIGTLSCTGVIGTPRFSLIDDAAGRVALSGPNNATVVAGLVGTNFETTPFFNFSVSVFGTSPQLPNVMFTVNVHGVNEYPPVIISDGGTNVASISILENVSVVTTVVATDEDAGDTITYSIAGGDDESAFTIDPGTGVLSFVTPPDYEQPSDADHDNIYIVIVQASDGMYADTQTITVTVEDVFDPTDVEPPVIISPSNLSIAENSTFFHTLMVANNEFVTWEITGGADQALFTLAGSQLSMAAKDFEAPFHSNQYIVEVTATDFSGNFASHTITVTVTAINEHPPIIHTNGGGLTAAISIPENTYAVTLVQATDADGDNITYSIAGGLDAAKFAINPTTGDLVFRQAPDYEIPGSAALPSSNDYEVIVQASDGQFTDQQTITVSVTDVFDDLDITPPVILSTNAVALAENQPLTLNLLANEATVTWAITGGADAGLFTIDLTVPTQPQLKMDAKDHELPGDANFDNIYLVTITCTDAVGLVTSQNITVAVTNVNEFAPVITSNGGGSTATTINVLEGTTTVTTVTAADADSNAVINYFISGGRDAAKFDINPSSGIVTFKVAPDYEVPGSADVPPSNRYIVIVQASDGTLTDTQILNVDVTDVAEDTTPDAFTFTDAINAPLSSVVESNTITVTGINAPSMMTILNGQYQINPPTGSYASTPVTVNSGDTVRVRGTSSASNSTPVNVTLTIGGVSDIFTITTLAVVIDTTPNAFSFTDLVNQPIVTLIESNAITVAGINAPSPMTVSGGEYQINGGIWASTPVNVVVGNQIKVRRTSSALNNTATSVTLTIGGVSDTFAITTASVGVLTPTVELAGLTDKGLSSTDNITNNNKPVLDIICATPPLVDDIIEVARDGVIVATATLVASDIAGTTTPGLGLVPLPDGVYTFTARQTRAGNVSSYSTGLSILIDTVAPILTSQSGAQNGSLASQADLTVTTDTGEGKIYWMIQDAAWAAPSIQQIIDHVGVDGFWVGSGRWGVIDVISAGAKSATATISVSGNYKVYFTQTDVAGNNATVAPSLTWLQTMGTFAPAGVGGFDASTTYMVNTGLASSVPAGKKGLVSFWIRMLGGNSTARSVFTLTTGTAVKFWCTVSASNIVEIKAREADPAGGDILVMYSMGAGSPFTPTPTGWVHVAAWWDLGLVPTLGANASGGIYINGVHWMASTRTLLDKFIGYNRTTMYIGSSQTATTKHFGSMSELYINMHETLDLGNPANLARFITTDKKPVFLGLNGELPSGTAPEIYLGDDNTYLNWGVNNGTKGNFSTPAGALTNVTGPP